MGERQAIQAAGVYTLAPTYIAYYIAPNWYAEYQDGSVPFSGVNPTTVFQNVLNAMNGNGWLHIKGEVTAQLTGILTFSQVIGQILKITGDGLNTKIYGDAASGTILRSLNAAYIAGTHQPYLILENIYMRNSMQNAAHIALDLPYCLLVTKNFTLVNSNATHRGIGLKLYPKENPGFSILENMMIQKFGTNYYINQDQVYGLGVGSSEAVNYDFYISEVKNVHLRSVQVGGEASDATVAFYFNAPQQNCLVDYIEGDTMIAGMTVFFHDGGTTHIPQIRGFDSRTANMILCNDISRFTFRQGDRGALYKVEAKGASAIVSGQTHVHVPHTLAYTPTADQIHITPTAKSTADPTFYYWIDGIDATEFVVNVVVDPGVLTFPFAWRINPPC
jgi:hypothetical protein